MNTWDQLVAALEPYDPFVRVPTAIRTAQSISQMDNSWYGDLLNKMGWQKYLLDIPKAPAHNEPLYMRTFGSPSGVFDKMGFGNPGMEGAAGGAVSRPMEAAGMSQPSATGYDYSGHPGIVAVNRNPGVPLPQLLSHETQHIGFGQQTPKGQWDAVNALQGPEWDKDRRYVEQNWRIPQDDKWGVGNEMMAEMAAHNVPHPNPQVEAGMDWSRKSWPQEMAQPNRNLILEAIGRLFK